VIRGQNPYEGEGRKHVNDGGHGVQRGQKGGKGEEGQRGKMVAETPRPTRERVDTIGGGAGGDTEQKKVHSTRTRETVELRNGEVSKEGGPGEDSAGAPRSPRVSTDVMVAESLWCQKGGK